MALICFGVDAYVHVFFIIGSQKCCLRLDVHVESLILVRAVTTAATFVVDVDVTVDVVDVVDVVDIVVAILLLMSLMMLLLMLLLMVLLMRLMLM